MTGVATVAELCQILVYGSPAIVTHMKTTIDLPDGLFRRVKDLAQSEGVSMRELMIDGLMSEVERRSTSQPRPDFVFRTFGGSGLSPDVDPATLTELAYDLPR